MSRSNFKWFVVLVALFLGFQLLDGHDTNKKSQKYEAVWTIKYNAETLYKIAELDDYIRQHFKGACKITVKIGESDNIITIMEPDNLPTMYFDSDDSDDSYIFIPDISPSTTTLEIKLPELHYELHDAERHDKNLYDHRDSTDHGLE